MEFIITLNKEKYEENKVVSKLQCKGQFRAFLPIYNSVPLQSIINSINKDGEEGKGRKTQLTQVKLHLTRLTKN